MHYSTKKLAVATEPGNITEPIYTMWKRICGGIYMRRRSIYGVAAAAIL